MTLQRNIIRETWRELLCGRTDAGAEVLTNNPDIVDLSESGRRLINIHTRREEISPASDAPEVDVHELEIWFDSYVGDDREDPTDDGSPKPDQQLDQLDLQVFNIVRRHLKLRGLVDEALVCIDETKTRILRWEADFREGEIVVAASRLSIIVAYQLEVPEVDIDDLPALSTIGFDWNLAGTSSDLEAQDEIAVTP